MLALCLAVVGAACAPAEAVEFLVTARFAYGDATQQFGDLMLPGPDRAPVVVLVHGGFWRNSFDLSLMEPLADDLVERGYAVWNLEYRRLGDEGGGWPGTLDDVGAGVDHLVELAVDQPIDLSAVAVIGHSAGGHLALWVAGRGSDGVVSPVIAIGQGAVVDLAGAAEARLGRGAVEELLGGAPVDVPARYLSATPELTAGPIMVSIVGSADDIVPATFSTDPNRPDDLDLVEIPGADHFDLIDPTHEAWRGAVDRLATAMPTSPT